MARKDVQEVNNDTLSKPEYSLKKGMRPKIIWPLMTWLFYSPISQTLFLVSVFFLLPGFEAAQVFLQARQVPDSWKVDLSEILESSSSDEDDGDGDGDGEGKGKGKGKEVEEEELKKSEPEEVRLQYFFISNYLHFAPEIGFPF